jgi:ferritin-like metal-binding protein YciE
MPTQEASPKRQTNLRHLLEEQIQDLYNAETRYADYLTRMSISSKDEDLRKKFEHVRDGTADNIEKLVSICDMLGIKPTGVKCEAMAGLLREAQETDEEYSNGSVKDAALIANAQRIAHYEIAGFGTASAFAKKLGLDHIAGILGEMADQSGAIDKKFTKIATGSWLNSGVNDAAAG